MHVLPLKLVMKEHMVLFLSCLPQSSMGFEMSHKRYNSLSTAAFRPGLNNSIPANASDR
jgi:hypothetical protein